MRKNTLELSLNAFDQHQFREGPGHACHQSHPRPWAGCQQASFFWGCCFFGDGFFSSLIGGVGSLAMFDLHHEGFNHF